MYSFVLTLHSYVRWAVLLLAVIVVVRAFVGWFGRKDWEGMDNRLGMLFTVCIDVQFLLGLALYLFLSPITTSAFQNFGAAMSNTATRYWLVEHAAPMLVAIVLAHVGRTVAKRAPTAQAKHRRTAIYFGLALLAILIAIPWPFLP